MTINNLIHKINHSQGIGELFGHKNWNKKYCSAVQELQHDTSNTPATVQALLKLNKLKNAHEKGNRLMDDAGEMYYQKSGVNFWGGHLMLSRSYKNFNLLKSINTKSSAQLHTFLPQDMTYKGNLKASWETTAYPLSGRQIPEHHVRWIVKQLLGFACYLSNAGYVHAGLHPDSIWIVPATKRIIIVSFYHLTYKGECIDTRSEKYKNWYPVEVGENNRAITQIDIEMIKRTALYLLGEQNGLQVNQHKRPLNLALVEFLLQHHHNAHHCYQAFQVLIKNSFEFCYAE